MATISKSTNCENGVHMNFGGTEKAAYYKNRKGSTTGVPILSMKLETKPAKTDGLLYGVEDNPPWYTSLLLGFQHYLLMFGVSISVPLLVTRSMCIGDDDVAKSEVIGTVFFVSGIATLLQSTFGTRLPIIQGGSFAFLPPLFAVLALPKWQCPEEPDLANLTGMSGSLVNYSSMENASLLATWRREVWTSRMREIQGAIVVASVLEVLVGMTGILGFLLRFVGPLTIAPTICLIGLSLYVSAANYCSQQWGIAALTAVLILLFSQYLRNTKVPIGMYNRIRGCHSSRYPVFSLVPVILAISIAWFVSWILTITNVFPTTPGAPGYNARTDTRLYVISEAQWFRVPYPGQWGWPTVSVAAVLGMFAGVISSIVESIGDYYACARLAGAPPPPVHAINRGILFEGFGVTLAGLWGTCSGVTSYSANVGAIGITKVGSRRVIQAAAAIMVIFGVFGKVGAVFVTVPDPILGGIFLVAFGLVAAVGVSNLQFVDLNSSRNLTVFGCALFIGLSVPAWFKGHPGVISTGVPTIDQILTVLLSTNMFVGGFIGFLLDNTVPGTPEERGLIKWTSQGTEESDITGDKVVAESTYDFPIGMNFLRRHHWFSYLPFSPTYDPQCSCLQRKQIKGVDNQALDMKDDDLTTAGSVATIITKI